MFERLLRWAHRTALFAAWAGGGMIIFAALMVTVDVFMRKFLNTTLGGADEISGYLFGIATAWALPYAFLHRANVRIDALYVHLPQTVRAVLDVFGASLLAVFAYGLTWRALAVVADSYDMAARSVTPLHVPLTLPQAFWVGGWVLFCLCLALVIGGMGLALLRRDLGTVHWLGGAMSIDDEIKEEGIVVDRTPEG